MSASRRLAKLKRSSMVNDVGSSNFGNTTKNVVNLTNNIEQEDSDSNLVKPVTILTWHEQRLNKIDNEILDMKESVNSELIVSLVETIEQMDKKLGLLSNAYDTLIEETTKNTVSKEIKKSEINTVKLNISEKE
tara:strand:- start:971 stop:1372 length:402 start_codon:yes stop_codon:yes gene_type:complete